MDSFDPILHGKSQFTFYPTIFVEALEMWKDALKSNWVPDEIDMSRDKEDWIRLKKEEQHLLLNILAFFAASDGIVCDNIVQHFALQVVQPEIKSFFIFQAHMENVHSETYSRLIATFAEDEEEKNRLLNSIVENEAVKAKADWCIRWLRNSSVTFAERLVAFAAVEAIFFSVSFATIFWFKKKGKLPGLIHSNDYIARDEALHVKFGCKLHSWLKNKVDRDKILEIVKDAVEHEKNFAKQILTKDSFDGFKLDDLIAYIEFVGNRLLFDLNVVRSKVGGHWPVFECPLSFMDNIALDVDVNFFEQRSANYLTFMDSEKPKIDVRFIS